MPYLGVRLNQKKHKDIIDWLDRFSDHSEEARRLIRLGISVSNGETVKQIKPSQPIVWNLPDKPTVPSVQQKVPKKEHVLSNILGSFDDE